jgi:hypothetical protein
MGILERIEAKLDQLLALHDEDPVVVVPPPDNEEDIDPVWLHNDVSDWPETSKITEIRFTPKTLEIKHTMAGRWKTIDLGGGTVVEGNPWVMAVLDGQLYAGTYEWLRPGQTKKNINAANIGAHIKKPPLATWTPKAGDWVYFMISALARTNTAAMRGSQERSDIVKVQWGTNWKA